MNQRESIPEYARLGESVDFFALNSHNNLHLFFLSFIFFLVFNEFFSFLFFSFFLGRNSGFPFQLSPKKKNSNNNNNNNSIKITDSYHSIKKPPEFI
jgi:hypothetical protein